MEIGWCMVAAICEWWSPWCLAAVNVLCSYTIIFVNAVFFICFHIWVWFSWCLLCTNVLKTDGHGKADSGSFWWAVTIIISGFMMDDSGHRENGRHKPEMYKPPQSQVKSHEMCQLQPHNFGHFAILNSFAFRGSKNFSLLTKLPFCTKYIPGHQSITTLCQAGGRKTINMVCVWMKSLASEWCLCPISFLMMLCPCCCFSG